VLASIGSLSVYAADCLGANAIFNVILSFPCSVPAVGTTENTPDSSAGTAVLYTSGILLVLRSTTVRAVDIPTHVGFMYISCCYHISAAVSCVWCTAYTSVNGRLIYTISNFVQMQVVISCMSQC
jgi:hypothetical protein